MRELLDPAWIEKPMFWALRAAENERPAVLQDELAIDRDTRGLSFRVEVWTRDELHVEEIIAASSTYLVAFAAYEASLKARQGSIVLLAATGTSLSGMLAPSMVAKTGD